MQISAKVGCVPGSKEYTCSRKTQINILTYNSGNLDVF